MKKKIMVASFSLVLMCLTVSLAFVPFLQQDSGKTVDPVGISLSADEQVAQEVVQETAQNEEVSGTYESQTPVIAENEDSQSVGVTEPVNSVDEGVATLYFEKALIPGTSSYKLTKATPTAKKVVANSTDSITVIGKNAFLNCTDVISIDLSKLTELTTIEEKAFFGCTKLEEIIIPSTVTKFGKCAFEGTQWLEDARKSSEKGLVIVNRVLVDGYAATGAVEVPNLVQSISEEAFAYNKTMKSLMIGSVSNIPANMCTGCKVLDKIDISGATTIGAMAFYNCAALKTVLLGSALTTINMYAFSNCTKLEEVSFEHVTNLSTIGYSAFADCTALNKVVFNMDLDLIDICAFARCTRLETISFCSSLGEVEVNENVVINVLVKDGAFGGCKNLKHINKYATGANVVFTFEDFALRDTYYAAHQ